MDLINLENIKFRYPFESGEGESNRTGTSIDVSRFVNPGHRLVILSHLVVLFLCLVS